MAVGLRKRSEVPKTEPRNIIEEFTDREDPQEAFERKFRAFSADWRENIGCVLCYYGIGGIGKTSLINKLRRLIQSNHADHFILSEKINCHSILYDFDGKEKDKDKLSILRSFRNQLESVDESFLFPRFDAAVILHAKKSGVNLTRQEESASILENNPWLNGLVATAGMIPKANWIATAIQIADVSSILWKKLVQHFGKDPYKDFLEEINDLEPSELMANLHTYFIADMDHNMSYISQKPLIVFLDTYEVFTDMTNEDISMITVDHWLRKGSSSVIQSIPGVLWVIAGRDKLYWAEDDDWGELLPERPLDQMTKEEKEALACEPLEQHLLGDLSRTDTAKYLEKSKVLDQSLYSALFDLTNGTPLYLSICVDTYLTIKATRTPVIDDFGKDLKDLISRYLTAMTPPSREMACFLACLGKWDDELVKTIYKKVDTLRYFTFDDYKRYLSHSFIIRNLDGSYYMHRTVREAIQRKISEEMKSEIIHLRLALLKEKILSDSSIDSNAVLSECVETLEDSIGHSDYDLFFDSLKIMREKICALDTDGHHELFYSLCSHLFHSAVLHYPSTMAEWITRAQYGKALCLVQRPTEGLDIISAIPLEEIPSADDKMPWVWVKNDVCNVFKDNRKFEEVLVLRKQILATCQDLFDEHHIYTIKAMNNLALAHKKVNEYQAALQLERVALQLAEEAFSANDLTVLSIQSNLATTYFKLGEMQPALDLQKQVLEARIQLLGETHIATLRSMRLLAKSYEAADDLQNAAALKDTIHSLYTKAKDREYDLAVASSDTDTSLELCEQRKQILRITKKFQGLYHVDTLDAILKLASSYDELGKYPDACRLQEDAVVISQKLLGYNHRETFGARYTLSYYYDMAGQFEKAEAVRQQLLNEGWDFAYDE